MACFVKQFCYRCSNYGNCDSDFISDMERKYMTNYNVKIVDYGNGKKQVKKYANYIAKVRDSDKVPNCFDKIDFETKKSSDARTEKQIEKSISNSVARTKNNIYNIIRSNIWDYFVTFTFDIKKIDSTNYNVVSKKMSEKINLIKKTKCPNMKYVLIPEYHKDGKKYHFHGLFSDVNELTYTQAYNPYNGEMITHNGKPILNIEEFKDLGHNTATIVLDSDKTCSYILKYITKELCCVTQGKKRYWASRNINKPKYTECNMPSEDFEKRMNIIADSMGCYIEYANTKDNENAMYKQKIQYYELRE